MLQREKEKEIEKKANDTIANICLTNKIFRTASHKNSRYVWLT